MTEGNSPPTVNSLDMKDNGKTKECRQPFPCKVYDMLEDASSQGFDNIVSWNPEGKGFMVHNKDKFTNEIIPLYFNQTKYKSFQRQLSLYGFERITVGQNKGLRHHEKLQRGCRQLCKEMKPIGYKPRGLEQKEKHIKKNGQKGVEAHASTTSNSDDGQQPQATSTFSIPAVVSTGSLHKEVVYQSIPRVTPECSPMRIAEVSGDECSTSSEDMGLFEGMSFYLMDVAFPAPAVTPPVAPTAKVFDSDFILQNPAEGLTRIISDDLRTIVPADGQLKKAWEIGFAVAMTMDPSIVPPPVVEPAEWHLLDNPSAAAI